MNQKIKDYFWLLVIIGVVVLTIVLAISFAPRYEDGESPFRDIREAI